MKLNAFERITLLQLLPAEGSVTKLRIVKTLVDALGFSEDEHKILGIKEANGQVSWNASADVGKDVEIGEVGLGLIRDAFRERSNNDKLLLAQLPVYERFLAM